MANTQEHIDRICEHRGLPEVKKMMRCEVNGKLGAIVGGNTSANFQVKFCNGEVFNCHPYYKMKIYNSDDSVLYQSDDLKEQ